MEYQQVIDSSHFIHFYLGLSCQWLFLVMVLVFVQVFSKLIEDVLGFHSYFKVFDCFSAKVRVVFSFLFNVLYYQVNRVIENNEAQNEVL